MSNWNYIALHQSTLQLSYRGWKLTFSLVVRPLVQLQVETMTGSDVKPGILLGMWFQRFCLCNTYIAADNSGCSHSASTASLDSQMTTSIPALNSTKIHFSCQAGAGERAGMIRIRHRGYN